MLGCTHRQEHVREDGEEERTFELDTVTATYWFAEKCFSLRRGISFGMNTQDAETCSTDLKLAVHPDHYR